MNSQYFSDTKVDEPGALVRAQVTLKDEFPVGRLIQGLQRGLDKYWVGSCGAADPTRHSC
ncbi:MAG: hypothetical protein ABI232_12645 [Jatrophihabitantaceae bacterium]